MTQGYDIVGDIHGHADALRSLLTKLGYEESEGAFRHPERRLLFLGDFIDRGPKQHETLTLVRAMCERGIARAVMGNHELNAIAWATKDDGGHPFRDHSDKNRRQHRAFLDEFGEESTRYREAINWFATLPVWLDLPGLRLIHACWHDPSRKTIAHLLDENTRFTPAGLRKALNWRSDLGAATELLLKGPEIALPDGAFFVDKDGHRRDRVRIKWWDPQANTLRTAAVAADTIEGHLSDSEIAAHFLYAEEKPVFFGHYWMTGRPALVQPHAACLDFSIAQGGHLTAYRWSGETRLREDNLVFVAA